MGNPHHPPCTRVLSHLYISSRTVASFFPFNARSADESTSSSPAITCQRATAVRVRACTAAARLPAHCVQPDPEGLGRNAHEESVHLFPTSHPNYLDSGAHGGMRDEAGHKRPKGMRDEDGRREGNMGHEDTRRDSVRAEPTQCQSLWRARRGGTGRGRGGDEEGPSRLPRSVYKASPRRANPDIRVRRTTRQSRARGSTRWSSFCSVMKPDPSFPRATARSSRCTQYACVCVCARVSARVCVHP